MEHPPDKHPFELGNSPTAPCLMSLSDPLPVEKRFGHGLWAFRRPLGFPIVMLNERDPQLGLPCPIGYHDLGTWAEKHESVVVVMKSCKKKVRFLSSIALCTSRVAFSQLRFYTACGSVLPSHRTRPFKCSPHPKPFTACCPHAHVLRHHEW